MNAAAALIRAAAEAGVALAADADGRVTFRGSRAALAPELIARLRANRDKIAAELQLRTAPISPPADPFDRIHAYLERLAIILAQGDVAEKEAHETATAQVGATLDDLGTARLAYWHANIEGLTCSEPRLRLHEIAPRCLEELTKPTLHDLAKIRLDRSRAFRYRCSEEWALRCRPR